MDEFEIRDRDHALEVAREWLQLKREVAAMDEALRDWVEFDGPLDFDGGVLDSWESTQTSYPAEQVSSMLLDAGADPEDVARIMKIKSQKDLAYLVKEKMGNRDLWREIQKTKIVKPSKRFEWRESK